MKSRGLLWAAVGLLSGSGARAFVGPHPPIAPRPKTILFQGDSSLSSASRHHSNSGLFAATLNSAVLPAESETDSEAKTIRRRRRRLALWAEEQTTNTALDSAEQVNNQQQVAKEQRLFQELYQAVMEHSSSKKGMNDDDNNTGNSSLLLQLQHSRDGSYRGVHLTRAVAKDEIVQAVPLAVCLRDDQPPAWFVAADQQSNSNYVSDDWATRLAACLLGDQFYSPIEDKNRDDKNLHHYHIRSLWRSLLPDPLLLRASLPVHWSDDDVKSAACTSLELSVDAAYFVRAQAVQDLMDAATAGSAYANGSTIASQQQFRWPADSSEQQQRQWCEQALDVVQTRTCRVEIATNGGTGDDALQRPVRLLAPVFDFINHRSGAAANCAFFVQDDCLVVQAVRDLAAGDEVLVDYGASARPAWKCLSSYGFVPDVASTSSNDEEDDNTAEVYIGGQRFEVSSTSIPETIVEAVADNNDADEEIAFTPDIARRLEQRISEAAYNMLLDPWKGTLIDVNDNSLTFDEDEVDDEDIEVSAEDILSAQLAAQLRFHQHRILLACAQGLGEWADNYQRQQQQDETVY